MPAEAATLVAVLHQEEPRLVRDQKRLAEAKLREHFKLRQHFQML
jgi:hypothetical protein